MSAASARRPKDRNGVVAAGTKPLKPFKPLTPVPISDKRLSAANGKENTLRASSSGPTSKARPRPAARPDRAASAGSCRWSTSSAPRGRSPSPSEFLRDRRVSAEKSVVSSAGKSVSRVRVSDLGKERKGLGGNSGSQSGELGCQSGIKVSKVGKEERKIEVVSEIISKICDVSEVKAVEREKNVNGDTSSDATKSKGSGRRFSRSGEVEESGVKFGNGVDLGKKEAGEKIMKEAKVLEGSYTKESKYQSKLHEKLAFLEGKVKRIASDIKRTKEMLDQNNPDTSKVILLDIQDKITGIEKAIGQVGGDSNAKNTSSLKEIGVDDRDTKAAEKVDDSGKSSVKGLNREELEARLFPHHKLLRNRTATVNASSGSSETVADSKVREFSCRSNINDVKTLSPIDANPIAMEFLASLNKEQENVTTRERKTGLESGEVEEADGVDEEAGEHSAEITIRRDDGVELILTTDERLDEFDDQENSRRGMNFEEEAEDNFIDQLTEIGFKMSTAGWFMSEGESVLLAHDDGSSSFHDVVNNEVKAVYEPPAGVSPNMWRDCWVIRAPSADGCPGRYVVAASAGNATDSGFCSWDFYTKEVRAFHMEKGTTPSSRMVLGPLPNNVSYPRNSLSNLTDPETRQWWYKPCGPLMVVTASCQRVVRIYDIRDGERIMKWDVTKPVLSMDYSSPLQWRNRGKVVVAETESISLWDVNSLSPQALLSVPSSGQKIYALHVNNTDAELGGGVRQRLSSSEAEGNDGVFCTQDSINILDFRHPTGVGFKIPKNGANVHSVFSRGDSVFLGCSNMRSGLKRLYSSEVQQFSLRKQRLFGTYTLPECNADLHHMALTQVWGNLNHVMGVCGLGLYVFDALRDIDLQCSTTDQGRTQIVREIVGPEDMYLPSFDYSASRALLISRDRPAMWRHLS